MNLIEPCILGGAVMGASVGAALGFSTSVPWGLGGLVAGALLGGISGPFVAIFLGLLFVTVAYGPRHTVGLLREHFGPRPPSNPG